MEKKKETSKIPCKNTAAGKKTWQTVRKTNFIDPDNYRLGIFQNSFLGWR